MIRKLLSRLFGRRKPVVKHTEELTVTDKGLSTLTISFDENLRVDMETTVNTDHIDRLVEHGYLTPDLRDDTNAAQIACALMAFDVLEQQLEEVAVIRGDR